MEKETKYVIAIGGFCFTAVSFFVTMLYYMDSLNSKANYKNETLATMAAQMSFTVGEMQELKVDLKTVSSRQDNMENFVESLDRKLSRVDLRTKKVHNWMKHKYE